MFWSIPFASTRATFVHGLLLCSSLIVVAPLCPLRVLEEAAPLYPLPPLEEAMLSKHHRAYDPSETPAANRLRLNVSDLFQSNTVTGKRAQELINDAAAAGVDDCRNLAKEKDSNTARHLRRNMMKTSQWPKFYEVEVTCKNPAPTKQSKAKCK